MPELPEVETIRNGLRRFVLNREIRGLNIFDKKLIPFLIGYKKLENDKILEIDRVGKLLIFRFKKSPLFLLIHLKMTGQLVYLPKNSKKLMVGGHSDSGRELIEKKDFKHVRFQINFLNGDVLFLNDIRRFAYVKLVNLKELSQIKNKFGLEPLEKIKYSDFLRLLESRANKNIKAFLLDQSLVSGIGNIYADEILFASGVLPQRKVFSLKEIEKKLIFFNISRILKLAVKKRGTTFSNYIDVEGQTGGFVRLLKVYGLDGQKCKKCHNLILKDKVAGRGTHYCLKCQK
ncbi:MAG TPA: DNA-formamidopyrimidine glycosylase [bacterium]|nr:DNA-formamidopyrimidine glycosylase [bacterium]